MEEDQPKVESEVPGTQNLRGDAPTSDQNENVETSKPKIISSFIEVHTEVNDGEKVVRRHQVIRNGDHEKEISIEDKNKTKIPILRLRQTVEKVKARQQNSMEKAKKEFESQIPIRRPSIPKATDSKRTTEDEFDKLYEEVVKADDTVVKALETKFEEIIHDYDDNKLQPIDVEKVRRSKIPYLKRRSLHDSEGIQERNTRIIAAREKVKLRKSLSNNEEKYEKVSKTILDALNKKANENSKRAKGNDKIECQSIEIIQVKNERNTIDSQVIYTNNETGEAKFKIDTESEKSKPTSSNAFVFDFDQKEVNLEQESSTKELRETKITKTISIEQDNDISSNITQKTTTNDTRTTESGKKNTIDYKILENELKQPIQIGTPVLESDIQEVTETNETQKSVKVKTILSYNSKEEDFIENKLNNITIETEKLSEDIKTFARTNSKDFDTNLKTIEVETTKEDIVNENVQNIDNLKIENEATPSPSKTEFNNSFIDSYLRSRSMNFDTKFDESNKISTPKIENEKKQFEKESNMEILSQKDEEIRNPFFDTPKSDKNNTSINFNKETRNNIINLDHNKADTSDTSKRDKAENNDLLSKKEIANKYEVKEIANKYEVKERDDEFVTTFRGKVGRLISKIDSMEQIDLESQAKDPPNELPKKKSVLSKIAMFESLESETPAKAKPKPKPLKLVTKDIQPEVKAHVHVHTPLIVNEIFKPFYTKDGLKTNIETLHESEVERQFIEADKELYSDENKAEIAMTNEEQRDFVSENNKKLYVDTNIAEIALPNEEVYTVINTINEPFSAEEEVNKNADVLNELQEPFNFETHKEIDNTLEEVRIAYTPKDKTKHFKYENPKLNTPINDAPIIIPKFRPVREILSQFEPKYKNIEDDEVFHKGSFRTKVKEALDELKQADIDVKNVVHEGIAEDNLDETFDFDQVIEDTKPKSNVTPNLQDLTENFDIKSIKNRVLDTRRTASAADLNPRQAKGKVSNIVVRMTSFDRIELDKKEVPINIKEMPRKRSVSEKIALFERKLTPINAETTPTIPTTPTSTPTPSPTTLSPDQLQEKIRELGTKYQAVEVPTVELSNGLKMPVIAVGTANLEPRLIKHIIGAAIDMGYRAVDTAYIYGNEREVGEAIRDKIQDGTVKREDLFIISKLWSTFHREDLVEAACNNSLKVMGLDYFDLFLIHNPMSFKEGPNPLPKIATVLQYSTNDYLNAWFGMEPLVAKGLVRGVGLSNFNSTQVARVVERGRVQPVVNQVECHPYLSQERLNDFCAQRNITLSCFGVLGSKGTPPAHRGTPATVIDDPIVKVMASALNVTPAQLLIAYQLKSDRTVVVKSSSAAHLWENLQALKVNLTEREIGGLRLMHRNKRIFTFAGMGDTHKNYPFKIAF